MIKYHRPKKLPIKLNPEQFYKELTEAAIEIGNLNGLQKNLPNPKILIAPLLVKEATTSSKIEGTQSTVAEVLEYEATGIPKRSDTREVSNYKKAMFMAVHALKRRALNLSFIKTLHQILLQGTRGYKYRGQFRKDTVWLGDPNTPLEKAAYVSPEPVLVDEYMENLQKYIQNQDEPPLIKIGIVHYQFEAIHPFKDGNGRIGRILIPLYLYWEKILFQPILYISGYFEKNRNAYLKNLRKVDKTGKYELWLKFFLISVKEQAKETQKLITKIISLKNKVGKNTERIKSPYMGKVINTLFSKPIFKSKDLPLKESTSRRLLRRLVELKIVNELKIKGIKGKVYIFKDLVKLLSY